MAGSRFIAKQVERFELGDGDWVDLLVRLSYVDRAAIEKRLIGPVVALSDSEVPPDVAEVALDAANMELLKRTITAWGGPGFTREDGTVAPINESTIGALDFTAEKILDELKRRMVKPAKDFTPPPSPPTPTTEAAANTEGS